MKIARPGDILLSTVLAMLVLVGTLWGLHGYVQKYQRPFQNWLPQGSFRPDSHGGPLGWQSEQSARVEFERTLGNVPLNFLRLEGPAGTVSTQLALGQGWRILHVSVWHRCAEGGRALLRGLFDAGQMGPGPSIEIQGESGEEWRLSEAVWVLPAQAQKITLQAAWDGKSGRVDLAELSIVPGYVFLADRRIPTH